MQRADLLGSTFHFAPRIERLQSIQPRKRKDVNNFFGSHRGAVILIGRAPAFAQLAHLVLLFCCSVVLLFCREFRLHREGQRTLGLRAELMLGKRALSK